MTEVINLAEIASWSDRLKEITDRKEGILQDYHRTIDINSLKEREDNALVFMLDAINADQKDSKAFYFWRNVRAYWNRVIEMLIREAEMKNPIVLEFDKKDVIICDPIQQDIICTELIDALDQSVGMAARGDDFAVFGTIVNTYIASILDNDTKKEKGALILDGGIMCVMATDSDSAVIDGDTKRALGYKNESWFMIKKFTGTITITRHPYEGGPDYRTIEVVGNKNYTIQELIC